LDRDFQQIGWDASLEEDVARIVRLAVAEDLGDRGTSIDTLGGTGVSPVLGSKHGQDARATPEDRDVGPPRLLGDCTSAALVPEDAIGRAEVVVRQPGTIAGLPAAAIVLAEIGPQIRWLCRVEEGSRVEPGRRVARIEGPARGMLTAERTLLNLLGRLSGIATLTQRYVERIAGTRARIYDTRKTTPGWRRLEKYAVRVGGGRNHRTGLFDAVLIKDNHLAFAADSAFGGPAPFSPAAAVRQAREWLRDRAADGVPSGMIVEVEVDTLQQLDEVLPAGPDIVLLDNMSPDQLREAVARRDAAYPEVELEASGGIDLETVRAVAQTGVERISIGALTHAAVSLDLGLDWIRSA
jgi:nicotinate-nucleotide pyrophosphorylase (carboxylating)